MTRRLFLSVYSYIECCGMSAKKVGSQPASCFSPRCVEVKQGKKKKATRHDGEMTKLCVIKNF